MDLVRESCKYLTKQVGANNSNNINVMNHILITDTNFMDVFNLLTTLLNSVHVKFEGCFSTFVYCILENSLLYINARAISHWTLEIPSFQLDFSSEGAVCIFWSYWDSVDLMAKLALRNIIAMSETDST